MKVLCIMAQNIYEVNSGGSQCAKRNYEAIKDSLYREDELYTCIISEGVALLEKGNELYIPSLQGNLQSAMAALLGYKCFGIRYKKSIREFVAKVNPDVIYLDTSKLGILARCFKKKYECKVITFFHNVEADYSLNFVKNKGIQYLLAYYASRMNEKMIIKYADITIALNNRDSNRINELYGRMPEEIIPISVNDEFEETRMDIDKSLGLLFIGSFFPPNYHGIKWFVDEVMSELPQYKLTIVGKNFEKVRHELERDNVCVVGTVDDLREYYYTYPALVMPIQYGSGMKVKTCEAMMYGKHIFASDEALEGYDVGGVSGIERCNTPREYVNAISAYFTDMQCLIHEEGVRKCFLDKYESKKVSEKFYGVIYSTK